MASRDRLLADRQPGLAIGAHLLDAGIQRRAEVDVGRAALWSSVERKRIEIDAELGVSALVLAEHLEEDLVGVHGDDGVEQDEGERVVAEGPVEERLLRLAQAQTGRLSAHAEVSEVGGAILGDIAIIAADDGVERGHGFTEEQRLLQDAVEAHRVAVDVAEESQLGRAAAGDESTGVLVTDGHGGGRRCLRG